MAQPKSAMDPTRPPPTPPRRSPPAVRGQTSPYRPPELYNPARSPESAPPEPTQTPVKPGAPEFSKVNAAESGAPQPASATPSISKAAAVASPESNTPHKPSVPLGAPSNLAKAAQPQATEATSSAPNGPRAAVTTAKDGGRATEPASSTGEHDNLARLMYLVNLAEICVSSVLFHLVLMWLGVYVTALECVTLHIFSGKHALQDQIALVLHFARKFVQADVCNVLWYCIRSEGKSVCLCAS